MNRLEQLGLRDIVTPTVPGWWPPAPGWWMTAAIGGIFLALAWEISRRRRRTLYLRDAALELRDIQRNHRTVHNPVETLRAVSTWLRQVCIARYGQSAVAGLSGQSWLAWLDRSMGGSEFRESVGTALLDGPYRQSIECDDLDRVFDLCHRWLRSLHRQAG